jgi:hypothetical protein
MGDPISIAVAGASLASTGLSAAGTLSAGKGQAAGAQYASQQALQRAEYGKIQANLTDTSMRDELTSTLANIDAIRASSGDSIDSPTAVAIKDRNTEISDTQRTAKVLSIREQVAQDESDAAYYQKAAKLYTRNALISAGAGIAGGLVGAYGNYTGSGSGGSAGTSGRLGFASPRARA